jgi:hypothetical protein
MLSWRVEGGGDKKRSLHLLLTICNTNSNKFGEKIRKERWIKY